MLHTVDYAIILIFFVGLLAVGYYLGKHIATSKDMFIAGRNSSWWLSGLSTYMTLFSASTFVVWGGVAYRSGLVAAFLGMMLGVGSFAVGRWISGIWSRMKIDSPAEYLTIRFGRHTLNFYSIVLIFGRGVHTAVSLYAIGIMVVALMPLPEGHMLADPATGHLSVTWAIIVMGIITLVYTAMGGYLAVLMTDVVQFAILFAMILILVPLSIHAVGGLGQFVGQMPAGHFRLFNEQYTWQWLILWCLLNAFTIGGDWPFVQRYISVPNAREARKSSYLVGILYILTPILWYTPAMAYRIIDPAANPEQAYMLISERVLGPGLLGFMVAAMISATLSMVSGTLNVFANVFTNDLYAPRHKDATERQKIRVGKLFTYLYGAALTVIAALIPYMGGAEKVVVTILVIVIMPIFIPSIWGLFSRHMTARDIFISMGITYVAALLVKFRVVCADWVGSHAETADAIVGCLLPILILIVLEWVNRRRATANGYTVVQQLIAKEDGAAADQGGTAADQDSAARKAGAAYSSMAIRIMMGTYLAIGLISIGLSFVFAATGRLLLTVGLVMSVVALVVLLLKARKR
ncbi:MAG: sodium:solute symporter [Bacteroidaceae bacterium]|nr:sodium:solute symporter [Bacteroidaceae bacterium]